MVCCLRIGVVFPQTELGGSPQAARAYAQGTARLGFTHILAYEHVLGTDTEVHANWRWPYDLHSTFHEPFVLFGYLAGLTSLELVTAVVVLPQRQTPLVAKQAAEVDLLTEGRFRLGVGLGWNHVEYDAMGRDFWNRGRRFDEQVVLLRRLWTEQSVTFTGGWERVRGAGLAPRPLQQPIPIWLGCNSEPGYRRAGRLAEGWFPPMAPGPRLVEAQRIVAEAAVATGRDATTIGMEGRVVWGEGGAEQVADELGRWAEAGASHAAVNTMGSGLGDVDGHLEALEAVARAAGLPA
jgi:probable F420-dependent oxidoreductase